LEDDTQELAIVDDQTGPESPIILEEAKIDSKQEVHIP